jgi:hypothetical protein
MSRTNTSTRTTISFRIGLEGKGIITLTYGASSTIRLNALKRLGKYADEMCRASVDDNSWFTLPARCESIPVAFDALCVEAQTALRAGLISRLGDAMAYQLFPDIKPEEIAAT